MEHKIPRIAKIKVIKFSSEPPLKKVVRHSIVLSILIPINIQAYNKYASCKGIKNYCINKKLVGNPALNL